MLSGSAKILLTGFPGSGKTTAVKQILQKLNCRKVAGFYTQEIRENTVRKGFSWTRLDGLEGVLAHVDFKSRFSVGRYGVDVAGFERQVVPALDIDQCDADLFVIDEIGKMECFSEKFVAAVRRLFDSDKSILATIAQEGSGFIADIRNYPGVKLFKLTRNNHDEIINEIVRILSFL